MRKKEWKLVITFESTQEAMKMEKICGEKGATGRLIPVPTEISAGCGLCWCSNEGQRDILEQLLEREFKEKTILRMKI